MNERAYPVRIVETGRILIRYPSCGHEETVDLNAKRGGKRGPGRVGDFGTRFTFKYWSSGGVSSECSRCKKTKKGRK